MGTIVGVVDGSLSATESLKSNYRSTKKEYKVIFDIIADNVDETWEHILNRTPGLPQIKQSWKNDGCRCKKRNPKNAKTIVYNGKLTLKWSVECSFDSDVIAEEEEDPTKWPTTLSISSQEVTESLERDVETNKPIMNPNKERILIEIPNSYPVIEFSRYEPYPDTPDGMRAIIATFNRFKNRINSAPFLGFPAGTCFMYAPQTTREQINGSAYFKVNYRILVKADEGENPFMARTLCEGYMIQNPDKGGMLESTAEAYGQNIKVNLSLEGLPLESDKEPIFLEFNQYKSVDFNELGLLPG